MQGFQMDLKDRQVIQRLAGHVAELASRPVEKEKKILWYRHNSLEAVRPLIFCDPENGWSEIITPEQLECSGELARQWEVRLRKEIFRGESMCDDRVIEPYFDLTYVADESDWGMHETKTGGNDGGSYRWEAPLKDYKDMDKLHYPVISVQYKKTISIDLDLTAMGAASL